MKQESCDRLDHSANHGLCPLYRMVSLSSNYLLSNTKTLQKLYLMNAALDTLDIVALHINNYIAIQNNTFR